MQWLLMRAANRTGEDSRFCEEEGTNFARDGFSLDVRGRGAP